MNPRNRIWVESHWGLRFLELYQGDLTTPEHAADVLVCSTFAGDYSPVPGTLIGGLHASGINVSSLANNCEFDLRNTFSLWVSRELHRRHFKRLICLEFFGSRLSASEVIENIF